MRAAAAVTVACAIFAAAALWRALNAMCQEEIETRLGRLPKALLGLAALRLPRDVRSDLASEWAAELDFVVSETDGLPVTRLLRGLVFAGSLLRAAPSVARELAGSPRTGSWAAADQGMGSFFLLVALWEAIGAFDAFSQSHLVGGISSAALALGCLFCAMGVGLQRGRARVLYALGCLAIAVHCFLSSSLIDVAEGIAAVGAALMTLSLEVRRARRHAEQAGKLVRP
jgi:hypothetical protein